MKNNIKKNMSFIFIFFIYLIFVSFIFADAVYAADPTLITKLNKAFEKIKNYILKLSTPVAAVALGSGALMKKFSFGDEEKIRTGKRLIRGSLFSYAFLISIDLILSTISLLLT